MTRFLGILAAFVLTLVAVVPAGAVEVPTHAACTKSDSHLTVGSNAGTVDTPMLPTEETTASFVIDLEGQPTTKKGSLTVDMTWGDPTDFDLDVNGVSSAALNVDGTGESVSLTGLAHCSTITVTAINFTGNPLATLDLSMRLTAK